MRDISMITNCGDEVIIIVMQLVMHNTYAQISRSTVHIPVHQYGIAAGEGVSL